MVWANMDGVLRSEVVALESAPYLRRSWTTPRFPARDSWWSVFFPDRRFVYSSYWTDEFVLLADAGWYGKARSTEMYSEFLIGC